MLLIYKHISAIILIDQDFNNPVPKKKHDPYAPSAIVKPALTYSTPWRAVNRIANTNVIAVPNNVAFRSPSIKAWWAYVTVAPDESSRIVFNNGIAKG